MSLPRRLNSSSVPTDFIGRIRRAPAWWLLALAVNVAFCLWLLSAPEKSRAGKLLSLWVLTGLDFAVAWTFFLGTRRTALADSLRRALGLISAGMAVAGLGNLYFVLEATLDAHYNSIFSPADALFILSYPLIMLGLFSLPRGEAVRAERRRIVIDGMAFVIGVGVPLWLGAVGPAWRVSHGSDAVLMVFWPLLALLGLFGLNAALLTRSPVPSRPAFWLLFCSVGVSWLADLVFSLDAAAQILKGSPFHWTNLINAVALGLGLLAAWRFLDDPIRGDTDARPISFSPVPMVTMILVATLLIGVSLSRTADMQLVRHILPGLIVLFLVLLVREVFGVVDTVRWMALERLRGNQEQIEAMVTHSTDILMVVDELGRIRFASPAVQSVLGRTSSELVGQPLLKLAHPEDVPKGEAFLDLLQENPAQVGRLEWRLCRADGSSCHLETAGSNALAVPTIRGLVLNSRDTSERVGLERQLTKAQRMESIGLLAAGVVHDLNNMLTPISLGLSLLRDKSSDPVTVSTLQMMETANQRGAAVLRQVLTFARGVEGERTILRPGHLLGEIARLVEETFPKSIRVETEIAADIAHVSGNQTQLHQVLLNLLLNARDALPQGGRITLHAETVEVDAARAARQVPAVPPGRYVLLGVRDNGPGIVPEVMEHMFEPFYTTKLRGKGTGLGLSTAFGIVKSHQGFFEVVSVLGQGSDFCLLLPAADRPAPAPASRSASPFPAPQGAGRRLLVGEAAQPILTLLRTILTRQSYQVVSAVNGRDALGKFEEDPGSYALVLTDLLMPEMDGFALIRAIRGISPQIPIIAATGMAGDMSTADREALLNELRVGTLLQKPFAHRELMQALQRELGAAESVTSLSQSN